MRGGRRVLKRHTCASSAAETPVLDRSPSTRIALTQAGLILLLGLAVFPVWGWPPTTWGRLVVVARDYQVLPGAVSAIVASGVSSGWSPSSVVPGRAGNAWAGVARLVAPICGGAAFGHILALSPGIFQAVAGSRLVPLRATDLMGLIAALLSFLLWPMAGTLAGLMVGRAGMLAAPLLVACYLGSAQIGGTTPPWAPFWGTGSPSAGQQLVLSTEIMRVGLYAAVLIAGTSGVAAQLLPKRGRVLRNALTGAAAMITAAGSLLTVPLYWDDPSPTRWCHSIAETNYCDLVEHRGEVMVWSPSVAELVSILPPDVRPRSVEGSALNALAEKNGESRQGIMVVSGYAVGTRENTAFQSTYPVAVELSGVLACTQHVDAVTGAPLPGYGEPSAVADAVLARLMSRAGLPAPAVADEAGVGALDDPAFEEWFARELPALAQCQAEEPESRNRD